MRFVGLIVLCFLAVAAVPVPATAAPKFYVALDVGSSRGEAEYFHDFAPLLGEVEDSDSTEGVRIRVGYEVLRFLALEVGYADLGDFEYSPGAGTCPPLFEGRCDFTTHSSARGWLTNAVGMFPLNDRFRVKGRAGWMIVKVEASETGADATVTDRGTDSEAAFFVGAGIEFHATERLDVELGWMRVDGVVFGVRLSPDDVSFNQGKVSLASIGLAYKF